jgi:antitoxin (DNA-binding transcriptional repressor) of toxin-antitoxin stability system
MIKVNVHAAKTRLSVYLRAIKRGERVVICNRNHPVAELRAVAAEQTKARKIGWAKNKFKLKKSFFQPLPDDVLKAFEAK